MLVKVKIDNLNDVSKPILSIIKKPDKIKRLIKKDINIKKDALCYHLLIFFQN